MEHEDEFLEFLSLLGGHRGANVLAQDMGKTLSVTPSITTASEARFGVALDAPPAGEPVATTRVGFLPSNVSRTDRSKLMLKKILTQIG